MSDVKRLPDADGWWWMRGERVGECQAVLVKNSHTSCPEYLVGLIGGWQTCRAGQWQRIPAPEWPPEPPPRPRMVWASSDAGPPQWWVRDEDGDWIALGRDSQWRQDGMQLDPHDHPEQSAEESRRILAENNS